MILATATQIATITQLFQWPTCLYRGACWLKRLAVNKLATCNDLGYQMPEKHKYDQQFM